ncbi:hypothetical protein [Deinococcus sp. QL22]|uniref:hypothetical protein n=1 Tax=Deinococcus sp. QL22 TaxID=2939437 RepID=UPI002016DDAE|nr:hypothetical protein [Deinococcus sp. QL22]UQN04860.1 hypothetical protein M1R55_07960 [Deinococcus sp. QL22]
MTSQDPLVLVVSRLQGLALTVPLLWPHDALLPVEWAELDDQGRPKAKGERGLHLYLAQQAPNGYVQVYEPMAALTDRGVRDQHWGTVDAVASTCVQARALAQLIRRISGTPRTGGRVKLFTPAQATSDRVSTRVTLQFQVHTIHAR